MLVPSPITRDGSIEGSSVAGHGFGVRERNSQQPVSANRHDPQLTPSLSSSDGTIRSPTGLGRAGLPCNRYYHWIAPSSLRAGVCEQSTGGSTIALTAPPSLAIGLSMDDGNREAVIRYTSISPAIPVGLRMAAAYESGMCRAKNTLEKTVCFSGHHILPAARSHRRSAIAIPTPKQSPYAPPPSCPHSPPCPRMQ